MAEYIEREEALNLISDIFFATDPNGEEQCGVIKCSKAIRNAPAADVVEIVRCKDCKYFDIEDGDALGTCMGKFICVSLGGEVYPEPNHYCSYGERRSD